MVGNWPKGIIYKSVEDTAGRGVLMMGHVPIGPKHLIKMLRARNELRFVGFQSGVYDGRFMLIPKALPLRPLRSTSSFLEERD